MYFPCYNFTVPQFTVTELEKKNNVNFELLNLVPKLRVRVREHILQRATNERKDDLLIKELFFN